MILALKKMKNICEENDIQKIVMPTIGAGLDRLPWDKVAEQIREVFQEISMEILVCKWE